MILRKLSDVVALSLEFSMQQKKKISSNIRFATRATFQLLVVTCLSVFSLSKRHVPSPERPAGSAEPFPVCDPRGGDRVARGGRQTGASLLAAADGSGSAGPGNGRHAQVHPKR